MYHPTVESSPLCMSASIAENKKKSYQINDQITRQFHILKQLSRYPKKITVQHIQKSLLDSGFKISIRTIQRDINALSQVFNGIGSEKINKEVGWFWCEDAPVVNLAGLTVHQALSFSLVKKYLSPVFPALTLDDLDPYFKEAENTLGVIENSNLVKWPQKIAVVQPTQPLLPPKVDMEVKKIISSTLLAEQQLVIDYQRQTHEQKQYLLNPLGLVLRGQICYLIATLVDTEELRIFAIHRILHAQQLEKPARQPQGFNLETFVNEGYMGFVFNEQKNQQPIQLQAVFERSAARHLTETPLSLDQTMTPYEYSKMLITATVWENQQLLWWLLGFGDQVEVLKPLSLRDQIINIIGALSIKYKVNHSYSESAHYINSPSAWTVE